MTEYLMSFCGNIYNARGSIMPSMIELCGRFVCLIPSIGLWKCGCEHSPCGSPRKNSPESNQFAYFTRERRLHCYVNIISARPSSLRSIVAHPNIIARLDGMSRQRRTTRPCHSIRPISGMQYEVEHSQIFRGEGGTCEILKHMNWHCTHAICRIPIHIRFTSLVTSTPRTNNEPQSIRFYWPMFGRRVFDLYRA